MVRALGNSVGVAITQPRVEAWSASTLGAVRKNDSNAVSVALSQRRYRSEFFLLIYCDKIQLRITPTAKRNSYRVAILVGSLTQGSVLRPQPWAGKTQLRQSCCCLRGVQPEAPPQPSPRTWSSILLWVKALDINIISFGENIGRAQTIVTQPIWSPVQNSFQSRWC